MKVSVVTISFNQVGFLERAMKSVLDQDYDDVEYIVVDPGSTDGSRDIIDRYRSQLDTVILDPDEGPADGLNKGFAAATGHVFCYLNSDDELLPGAIRQAVQAFENNSAADVITGNGYMVDEDGIVLRRFYSDRFTPWRFVHGGAVVIQQSTFIKRSAFLDVGGFNSDNPIWWDAELLLDLGLAGKKIIPVRGFWSLFRIHRQSISGQKGDSTEAAHSLDVKRRATHERLYGKVMGRALDWRAKPRIVLARLQKWALRPYCTSVRLLEKLGIRLNQNHSS